MSPWRATDYKGINIPITGTKQMPPYNIRFQEWSPLPERPVGQLGSLTTVN